MTITQVRSGSAETKSIPGGSGIAFVGMQIESKKPVWKRIKRFVKGLFKHERATRRRVVL
jgi:hypothetical protein